MAITKVTPGVDTSEYKETKSAGIWGIVAMILGILTTIGATIAESLGNDTSVAVIVGAVVATVGIAQKTLVSLGYISSRTKVKDTVAK